MSRDNPLRRLGYVWGKCRDCEQEKWLEADFNDEGVEPGSDDHGIIRCKECTDERIQEWVEDHKAQN